jgi:hypothetical protein
MLCYMLCHVICYVMVYVMLYYMLCYVMLYLMSCYMLLCYMLCYVMLCYVMLLLFFWHGFYYNNFSNKKYMTSKVNNPPHPPLPSKKEFWVLTWQFNFSCPWVRQLSWNVLGYAGLLCDKAALLRYVIVRTHCNLSWPMQVASSALRRVRRTAESDR